MKILILTFFYPPDLSACAFRAKALVDALTELGPPGSTIDVLTTIPNRYTSFTAIAAAREELGGASITRFPVPEHRGGAVDQARAFLAYARAATTHVLGRNYDIVFATSSRLMTATLGAHIVNRLNTRLYLDIRDIIADTIVDVIPGTVGRVASPVLSLIERWTIQRAEKVNLVSRGFETYFRDRYPAQRFSFFTNGIDDEFLNAATWTAEPHIADGRPLKVLYAGNVGEGQGLHLVIPRLAGRMQSRVEFTVIGDGGRKQALEQAIASEKVTNVHMVPPMPRDRLIEMYRGADVLFLHLNDYEAFERVLPSKVFEYAAVGKPIWAGVAGYAAEFIHSEIDNAGVFEPCDVEGAIRAFDELTLATTPRSAFIERYARSGITRELAKDILAVVREGG